MPRVAEVQDGATEALLEHALRLPELRADRLLALLWRLEPSGDALSVDETAENLFPIRSFEKPFVTGSGDGGLAGPTDLRGFIEAEVLRCARGRSKNRHA